MSGWGYGNYGYRGGGMMGLGMMGGWGYSPFSWIMMTFMWLIPIGAISLTVFGVAWLVKNVGNSTPPALQNPCPNCGQNMQSDWQNCPYCGTTLK